MGKENLAVARCGRNGCLSCYCGQRFSFRLCTWLPGARRYPGLHILFCYFVWANCVCSDLRNIFKPEQGNGYVGMYLFPLGISLCGVSNFPDVTCLHRQRIYILDLYGNVHLRVHFCFKTNSGNKGKIIGGDRTFLATEKR